MCIYTYTIYVEGYIEKTAVNSRKGRKVIKPSKGGKVHYHKYIIVLENHLCNLMDKVRVREEPEQEEEEEDVSEEETEDEKVVNRNKRAQGKPRPIPIESVINPKLKRKLATFEFSTSQDNHVYLFKKIF